MGIELKERKYSDHRIGEVNKGWKLLEISYVTHKAIVQCEQCGVIKKVDISSYYNLTVVSCFCHGLTTWNNEPIVCNTDVQKQVLEMLRAEKTYAEIGNALGMTRQAVGSIVKTMRSNYQKYLRQLEKSNNLKAISE